MGEKDVVIRASSIKKQTKFLPESRRVCGHATVTKGQRELLVQLFVPFAVNMPMLHCVRYIRCLDYVFNDNSSPEIIVFFVR